MSDCWWDGFAVGMPVGALLCLVGFFCVLAVLGRSR